MRICAGLRYQKARRTHTRHPLLASSLGSMPATIGRTQRMQEGRQAGVSSISCLSCLTLRVAAGCRAAPCTGKRGQPPVLATFQPPVSGTSSGDTVAATAEGRLAPAPTPKVHEPGDNDSRRSEATDVACPWLPWNGVQPLQPRVGIVWENKNSHPDRPRADSSSQL